MSSIKHAFVSAKADGPDSTVVKPTDWNANHTMASDGASVYLGRSASGPGEIEELSIAAQPGEDFTIYTKASVDAAIAAAIAAALDGVEFGVTGDLAASLAATKTNYLLCDGRTIGNVGSTATFANALARPLFDLLWAINNKTWPILPSRGASASADWTALKRIALPDARGCNITMVNLSSGVNTLVNSLGVKVGTANRSLSIANVPSHSHTYNSAGPFATQPNQGGGAGWNISGNTGKTGGDPNADPPYSDPLPFYIVSPTIGANIFIRL